MQDTDQRHPLVDATLIVIAVALAGFALYRYLHKTPVATIGGPALVRVAQGQTVKVPIFINTAGQNINAAEVYMTFDPSQFEVVSVDKDGSFFQLWIKDQPAFSNERGEASFAGGLPFPGFKGRGQIGTVTIKPKVASLHTQFSFSSRTQVLLNDGKGTKVPLKTPAIPVEVTK
ncbi:MAG TPA: cohesin domain-containing protein [Candidatus Nanoarchaeia archaeon]|nr:cohesin domain-containing protein [Candidatus Nanoarchaeia archaeon]